MIETPCRNPNHPKRGSSIKVEPIRTRAGIESIKTRLIGKPRDLCLFQLGINTGLRANELLSLRIAQVRDLKPGDDLDLKLSKTKTYRRITLNQAAVDAIQTYLETLRTTGDDWLFRSKAGPNPLTVSTVSGYVKAWCREAGLSGNYASHSLRKTWGYWQRVKNNTPIPLLMAAFGHTTQQQTLTYLCIQDEEIAGVYMNLEL